MDATMGSEVNIAVHGNGELTREVGHTSELTKSDRRAIEVNEQGKVVELGLDASTAQPGHSTVALKANHRHPPPDRSWKRMLDPTANLLLQLEDEDAGPELDELEAIAIAASLTKEQSLLAQQTSLLRVDRGSDLQEPRSHVEMRVAFTSGMHKYRVICGGTILLVLIGGFLCGCFDKYLPKFITDRFRSDSQIQRDALAANRQ